MSDVRTMDATNQRTVKMWGSQVNVPRQVIPLIERELERQQTELASDEVKDAKGNDGARTRNQLIESIAELTLFLDKSKKKHRL